MALCNKCHQAPSIGSDSWCVGCAALEIVQEELKGRWGSSDLRRAANDWLVDLGRQIKVLRALSLRLQPVVPPGLEAGRKGGAGCEGATPKALAVPARQEAEEEKVVEPEPEGSYSYTYTDCEEEEELAEEREPLRRPPAKEPPVPPPAPPPVVKQEEEEKAPERRKKSREEKKHKARSSHRKGHERRKGERERHRGRRGGRKHQQVRRRSSDPNVRFHRKKPLHELKRLREEDFPGLPTPPPCPR